VTLDGEDLGVKAGTDQLGDGRQNVDVLNDPIIDLCGWEAPVGKMEKEGHV
jgi:hypothetical protein